MRRGYVNLDMIGAGAACMRYVYLSEIGSVSADRSKVDARMTVRGVDKEPWREWWIQLHD